MTFKFEMWGRGGVVVSALDFRSEGRWFDAQSLPWCCFLRQDALPHIVSLHPGVLMGTGDILLGGNPPMDYHPLQGGVAILSVASYYRNRDKLRPCGPPWRECDFYPYKFQMPT